MLAEPQVVRGVFQKVRERLLPLGQWAAPPVVAVLRQQVEDQVGRLLPLRVAQVALQGLEIGPAVLVGDHHLSVEHEGASRGQLHERRGDARETVGVVLPVAGHEPGRASLDVGHDAIAVVLHLVEPACARRRRVGKPGQLHVGMLEGVLRPVLFRIAPDLVHRAPSAHARREACDAVVVARVSVALLDEEPVVLAAVAFARRQAHEHPGAVQPFALQDELQLASAQILVHVAQGLPRPFVPEHHDAAAVLALRNGTFEVAVVERMVLHMHGQALVSGVVRGAFGDGPAEQRAVPFQPQVVMVAARQMVLHDEAKRACARVAACGLRARRLPGLEEIALLIVCGQLVGHTPSPASFVVACTERATVVARHAETTEV